MTTGKRKDGHTALQASSAARPWKQTHSSGPTAEPVSFLAIFSHLRTTTKSPKLITLEDTKGIQKEDVLFLSHIS